MATIEPVSNGLNKPSSSSSALVTETTANHLPQKSNKSTESSKPEQKRAQSTGWWFDFYTMAGHKSENQDSLLITTCLLGYIEQIQHNKSEQIQHDNQANKARIKLKPEQLPVLAVLADGVSACQFPKQASRLAVEIVTENIVKGLNHLYRQVVADESLFNQPSSKVIFEDESVAGIIKSAVIKTNDSMYFSQSYQRVAPLLSTLSGVLCIGDRVYLFHTGDSRIYRLSVDSTTVLSEDHRIHHGQDKGALSAALGADTSIDLQQTVFTLHQNEYLALMTDGVYEHIDPVEMQFEFSAAATQLQNTTNWNLLKNWDLSQQLCRHAHQEGSNDNLTIIMLGMCLSSSIKLNDKQKNKVDLGSISSNELSEDSSFSQEDTDINAPIQYKLPTGLQVKDSIDGFTVKAIIARTARSEVYLVEDKEGHEYVLKSPSLRTVEDGEYLRSFLKERKIGLSLSRHRRAGEPAYNQTDPTESMGGSALGKSGLLRYYPVPASSTYLYHLTEYIEGESLRAFMDKNGPCDVWQTHDLLTKIGMAVRVMHRNYLLHQDLKPENILLTKSGAVKLIDFGSVASSILKDNTRPPVGDLHYAAPEYYTDAPKGVHSDLFSIAVIGFELLTGSRPFSSQKLMSASDALVMPSHLLRQKQVPATSQQALLRALHRNTNVRHQAIGEFLQDFNPDNSASLSDPEPLIKSNPLLVWHGICLVQSVIIVLLLIKFLPSS